MSGSWKQRERQVAEWFGTVRNPLSGKNNVSDDGTRRAGDIVLKSALVEVKRRKKSGWLSRARATRYEANKLKKPWLHVEFTTGQPNINALIMDSATAKRVAKFLLSEWGGVDA